MYKRFLDFMVAALALLISLPVLAVLGLFVRLFYGSPALFRQTRPGLDGKPFNLYKFRTMTDKRDAAGHLLPDEKRLAPLGKFLRNSSLDELPEIFNVLKGEMSIVGPRPLLMEYLGRYTDEQMRRHAVKPGITGWAQIHGRNAITWEQKFVLDVWYVDHQTLWLDLKIIAITFWKIMKREGINQPGQATAEEFKGLCNTMSDEQRFQNWEPPEIEEGKPTKYHWVVQHKDKLRLGYKTDIGAFTYINAENGVIIEDFVQIGSHSSIYSVSTIDNKEGKVILKKNCRIGSHSVVMPGVTVGENSIIGACSFVNQNIPDNVVAVGVPARVIRKMSRPQNE